MIKKILFYYCFILALFITVSGVLSSKNAYQLSMQLIFLPVTIYFSYFLLVQFIDKKSSLFKEIKFNKSAIIFTIILFSILFISSIIRIYKNPTKPNQIVEKIKPSPSPKIEKITYVILKKEYQKDKINVRESPSKTGEIIGHLDNKPYLYIGKSDDWYEIVFAENKKGFVNNQFVELNSSSTISK